MSLLPRIFLLGPTASGKTELTKFCYDNFSLRLINVDSTQVYKDFDIGSAKPTAEELKKYPHDLISTINPDNIYSVAQFKIDVETICNAINPENQIPFFTGGTMMYFNALENPLDHLPETKAKTRLLVNQELKKNGLESMYKKLSKIDPILENKIRPTDTQRILRAIEVFYDSGKPLSSFYKKNKVKNEVKYPLLKIGLYPSDRKILHKVIEKRVDDMIKKGLVEEVEQILKKYPNLNDSFSSLRSVGYKQTYLYLSGQLTFEELREKIIFSSRQLAKRQLTWMRKMSNINFFDPYDKCLNLKVTERIKKFLDQS